jgi:hypothetical protein
MKLVTFSSFLLVLAFAANAAPPPNDNFANRIVIPSVPADVSGTTVDGSLEPGEPQAYHQLSTVWYEWVAPRTGIVRVRFQQYSNLVPIGIVYPGNALGELRSLDIFTRLDEANIDVQQGAPYQFRIAANQDTPYPRYDGPFTFRLEYNEPPPNDHFTNRIRLTNRFEFISFRNVAATLEPGEMPLVASGGRTVWYQWRAPESGTVRIVTGAAVGVYTGTDEDRGPLLTNACQPGLNFTALAGQIYQLVFDNCGPTDRNRPAGHSWTLSLNGASRWENAARETNGWTALTLFGDSGRAYVLEGSTNLTNWTALQTNSAATASQTFQDFTATNFSYRFYRARLLE